MSPSLAWLLEIRCPEGNSQSSLPPADHPKDQEHGRLLTETSEEKVYISNGGEASVCYF